MVIQIIHIIPEVRLRLHSNPYQDIWIMAGMWVGGVCVQLSSNIEANLTLNIHNIIVLGWH